jgi:hypothetical protein
VNALSVLAGARIVDEEGSPTTTGAELLDEQPCTSYQPPPSDNPPLIIELAEPFDISRLEVINSGNEEYTPGISVKSLRVELGQSPKGPWETQAEWTLLKGSQTQSRPLALKKTRYLRVTLVNNHGNKDWIGLGELRAWGRRSSPRDIVFTGAWETTYGEVRLTQTGQRITGCYGPASSDAGDTLFEGTFRDSAFVGTWREDRDGASKTVGPAVFTITAEGNLSGVWGYTPSERLQRWDGTKLEKPTITCRKPKKPANEQAPSDAPDRPARLSPPAPPCS